MNSSERRSILCPNCRRLISMDEPACPYCGLAHPGSWWKNNIVTRRYFTPNEIIRLVIIVNSALFVLSVILSPTGLRISTNPLTLLSPANNILLILGGTGTYPIDQYGRWWSLISAGYLHAGILHIFFNMMALAQIGPLVLREYGLQRMVIIYTLGGVAGFLLSYAANVYFTIGASASICSLIGALLYYGKSRGGIYGQVVFKQLSGWVIGLFLFGVLVPGINNWGHGGGLAGGILLGFLLGYEEKKRENALHKFLATGCIAATVIILAWAVATTIYYRIIG